MHRNRYSPGAVARFNLHDDQRRRIPAKGAVCFRLVRRDLIGGRGDPTDRGRRATSGHLQLTLPGRTLVSTSLAVLRMTLPSLGSPLIRVEATALACFSVICGGK